MASTDSNIMSGERRASVVVIGGGQAGLSAGYHLARRGLRSALAEPDGDDAGSDALTFVVLDAAPAAGGAWQHRWESLTMATVNGIFDLPGLAKPPFDPHEPSRVAVPRYFADFERAHELPILRPVAVTSVRPADDDPAGELIVETDDEPWRTRAVINATGTWTNPTLPHCPGQETFTGVQLHTGAYAGAEAFEGRRVAVVGGGISAVQHLEEIAQVAETFWYTRREPVFRAGDFRPEIEGREIIARVTADAEAGRPTGSVVSYTGLIWTPALRAAAAEGVLDRRPMFVSIEPEGVREADGSFTPVDVILWATGFKAALAHLDPLGLRNELGGIQVAGTEAVRDPRVHLVGFGPSQSTVGANRAGHAAALAVMRRLSR